MPKKTVDDSDSVSFDFDLFLNHVPVSPGVYRMIDQYENILYIGKAKNIKKRLRSYLRQANLSEKTKAMLKKIADIKVMVTNNETEALLLEQTLIKKHKPPYNILLRDDKSYPFICLSTHQYPQLFLTRKKTDKVSACFGPYPSTKAAKASLLVLQKIFKVRQCTDHFFASRQRPCLQYQLHLCKAPCVNYVGEDEYKKDVFHSLQFLSGKSQQVIHYLVDKMAEVSEKREYEKAIVYRDQIQQLQKVQVHQMVDNNKSHADVISYVEKTKIVCIDVLFIRNGVLLDHRSFFIDVIFQKSKQEILYDFLSSFYIRHADRRDFPCDILVPFLIPSKKELLDLIHQHSDKKTMISTPTIQNQKKLMQIAMQNAYHALEQHCIDQDILSQRFLSIKNGLELKKRPTRIECFDISHTQGGQTVASCVVFTQEGPLKKDYRYFNIHDIQPGDDCAALEQAVKKRYHLSKSRQKVLPDLLLIDGGKAQVNAVNRVKKELKLPFPVYGIVKSQDRRSGKERIIDAQSNKEYDFEDNQLGFLLIQHIRDEAHRFALKNHRKKRDKNMITSILQNIPGLGPKRQAAVINFFGGIQNVKKAEITDLMKVKGIHRFLAEKIYEIIRQ